MKRILFVCTGNTCRSSMAEAIANHLAHKKGLGDKLFFSSAGTSAWDGSPASESAQEAVKEHGIDLSTHQAQMVSSSLVEAADLILTMTRSHKTQLASIFPGSQDKLYTLYEYIGGENRDISDPYGQAVDVYQACARELEQVIEAALKKIKAELGGADMKIALGSDHGGFELKQKIAKYLEENNYDYKDFGTFDAKSVDYPDYALQVAEAIVGGDYDRGILVCGTGIGIGIAANKVPGIRAALCNDTFSARAAREHNDANILTLGERVIGSGLALDIVKTWLESEFAGGRHAARLGKIREIEKKYSHP
jgi:ribose 5-phosphate isomerase B